MFFFIKFLIFPFARSTMPSIGLPAGLPGKDCCCLKNGVPPLEPNHWPMNITTGRASYRTITGPFFKPHHAAAPFSLELRPPPRAPPQTATAYTHCQPGRPPCRVARCEATDAAKALCLHQRLQVCDASTRPPVTMVTPPDQPCRPMLCCAIPAPENVAPRAGPSGPGTN